MRDDDDRETDRQDPDHTVADHGKYENSVCVPDCLSSEITVRL